jgi:hypothetical protein
MKQLLLFALMSISVICNAQTYFFEDFTGGLTKFTTYDVDGNKPHANVSSLFGSTAPYKAWVSRTETGNYYAASTSYYTTVATSNDWLVTTSAVSIVSSSAYLVWKAKSFDSSYKDGYKVYVSITGNKVADFSTVLYTNSGENSTWTTRSVSLASYAGKSIYIAFVNNSTDKFILGIDDIFAGVTNFNMDDNTPQFTYYKRVAVQGTFDNYGSPVTAFTVKYTANSVTYTKTYTGLNVAAGASSSFIFSDSITVNGAGNAVAYTLEITSGSVTKSTSGIVTLASFKPKKKVVIEEGTGTWCGWCPRGFVYMKKMKNSYYPDKFIGIAVHNGVNDPMTDATYNAGLGPLISNLYPNGMVNRKYLCDPLDFETNFTTALNEFTPAEFNLAADWTDGTHTNIKLTTDIVFNIHYPGTANFRMAFVVIENDVKGTASGYNQSNYYAGAGIDPGDGWNLLPNPVPAAQMVYPDVARKIYDSFAGISGSIPATIVMNNRFKYEYTLALPSTVINKNETEIIAMLINNATGEIVNARVLKYTQIPKTGIETLDKSGASVKVRKDAWQVAVDVETKNPGPITAFMYTIDGKQLYNSTVTNANRHSFEIPYAGLRGIYIIRVKTNEGTFNEKIVLE